LLFRVAVSRLQSAFAPMNWPPLSPECSKAIADAIKDAARRKPADLFEHVAQQLQDCSGLDPAEFEARFEECKLKPRTYVLEDRCPQAQDPLTWVPMRYNDDTILNMLQIKAGEWVDDVLSSSGIDNARAFLLGAEAAFPELSYLRGSIDEAVAHQTLWGLYLCCSNFPGIMQQLDDADPVLAFRCSALIEGSRQCLFDPGVRGEPALLEALVITSILRVLGSNESFRNRYGVSSALPPELAALQVVENEIEALPSLRRLDETSRLLVVSSLKAFFPLEMLISTDAVPAHFATVKELLGSSVSGGVPFFLATVAAEHVVKNRNINVKDEAIDMLRLGSQCLVAAEKYSAQRAYELFLKKRGERHSWRLGRDDLLHRAVIRLCCFMGVEDSSTWGSMLMAAEALPERERGILKAELGRKDGLAHSPAYVLMGSGVFLANAHHNSDLGLQPAVSMVARVLEDAARTFDRSSKHKVVKLHLDSLITLAKEHRAESAPFEDLAFALEEVGPAKVEVRVLGA